MVWTDIALLCTAVAAIFTVVTYFITSFVSSRKNAKDEGKDEGSFITEFKLSIEYIQKTVDRIEINMVNNNSNQTMMNDRTNERINKHEESNSESIRRLHEKIEANTNGYRDAIGEHVRIFHDVPKR